MTQVLLMQRKSITSRPQMPDYVLYIYDIEMELGEKHGS